MSNILFTEKSNMITKPLMVILGAIFIFVIVMIYLSGNLILTKTNIWENLLVFLIITFSFLLIFLIRLTLTMSDDKLEIKFSPLITKTILIKNIKSMEIKTISPLKEFGGWGIRWGKKLGRGYTSKGKDVLAIELKNGKKYAVSVFDKIKLNSILNNYSLN